MKKKARKIALGVLILLVVAVVVVGMVIDRIAKGAVERGGTYALGVDTRVDSVSLSLMRGRLTMNGLNIDNPQGYETAHLMKSGRFELEVKTGTVFSETIEIPRFELDGLDLNIEQKLGGNNVSEVIENVSKLVGEEDPESKEEGKRLLIDSIVIRNIVAHVQLLPIAGKAGTLTIEVPVIELKDVSSEGGKGVLVSELVQQLFPAVLAAVVDKGRGVLPTDLAKDLGKDIEGLVSELGEDAGKLVEQAEESVDKLKESAGELIEGLDTSWEEAGKELEDAGRQINDAGKELEKALDVFGKKKEE